MREIMEGKGAARSNCDFTTAAEWQTAAPRRYDV